MHDSNGKTLKAGDEISSFKHGSLLKVIEVSNKFITIGSYTYSQEGFLEEFTRVIKVRPWKELAEEALAVQNASNLSGVANSFSAVVREVRARLESEGNGGNSSLHVHPVIQLWADKIASLTILNASTLDMFKAYDWCEEAAKK